MRISWPLRRWLRLPSRGALLLGLGALSAAGAQANTGQGQPSADGAPIAQADQASVDGLLIRTESGRIYLSEGGGEFQELRLGDMPEALLLQQLIEDNGAAAGAAGIRLGPMILAGSGGEGFHWPAAGKPATHGQPQPAGSSTPAVGTPSQPAPPQNSGAPAKAMIGPSGEKG